MWADVNFLQALISGGPSLILAVGILAVWKTWRSDCKDRISERDTAEARTRELQEKRIADHEKRIQDAIAWSTKYNDLATEVKISLDTMDRFMQTVEKTTIFTATRGQT